MVGPKWPGFGSASKLDDGSEFALKLMQFRNLVQSIVVSINWYWYTVSYRMCLKGLGHEVDLTEMDSSGLLAQIKYAAGF
jgi:hypothetical protein